MRARSLVLAFLWAGLFLAVSSQPLAAAAAETSAVKTGAPASKAEWDKLVADAKKEGTVVISAGPIGEARGALINAFQQKYGISLEIVLSRGEEALAKMETERRAGIFAIDAVMQGMTTYFNSSMLKAATIPIAPLLVLPEVLDLSKWRGGKLPLADKQGHLAVLALASTPHLLINTQLVKHGEITSHQDLLNPKWKGKLAMNDPSLAGAGTEWFTFVVTKAMGIEKGTAYMKQLAKQEPVVIRDQRLLSEWVARGKYAAALAPNKTTTTQLMRTGVPLAYADLKEPRPTSAGSGVITIADRAPHPNATKVFLNWLLSREGMHVFAKAYGYPPTRLDVPAEGVDPIFIPKPDEAILGEDYQLSKGAMLKLAGEIFKDLLK